MVFGQYLRIEKRAGGVHCSRKQFIRASRRVLSKYGRGPAARQERHRWMNEGLQILANEKQFAAEYGA